MKKHPLFIVIYVAAAVAIIGYAYTVFNGRYGKKTQENVNGNNGSIIDSVGDYLGSSNDNANIQGENGNLNENQNENSNANENDNAADSGEVTSKDCDKDCVRFKNNNEKYKYCQEVCGDIPVSTKNSQGDCADLSGLEKDYCWRDLAVSKKDPSVCAKISDQKLKTVCRNRVTEELLN